MSISGLMTDLMDRRAVATMEMGAGQISWKHMGYVGYRDLNKDISMIWKRER